MYNVLPHCNQQRLQEDIKMEHLLCLLGVCVFFSGMALYAKWLKEREEGEVLVVHQVAVQCGMQVQLLPESSILTPLSDKCLRLTQRHHRIFLNKWQLSVWDKGTEQLG